MLLGAAVFGEEKKKNASVSKHRERFHDTLCVVQQTETWVYLGQ